MPFSMSSPSAKSTLANAPSKSPVSEVQKEEFLTTTLEHQILAEVGRGVRRGRVCVAEGL